MPCYHIKWRMILHSFKQVPTELLHQSPFFGAVLVICHRGFKVSRIGQAPGSYRPKVRQSKMVFIDLSNVPPAWPCDSDLKPNPTLNDTHLPWLDGHQTHFCSDLKLTSLGNQQQISI
eukprot:EG_transcript_21764